MLESLELLLFDRLDGCFLNHGNLSAGIEYSHFVEPVDCSFIDIVIAGVLFSLAKSVVFMFDLLKVFCFPVFFVLFTQVLIILKTYAALLALWVSKASTTQLFSVPWCLGYC
jgi:hypothetical protein